VLSKFLISASMSAKRLRSSSITASLALALNESSSMIFFCLAAISLAFFSFPCALDISTSMSTWPLTSRKMAASAETTQTAQPVGGGSEGDRIEILATPFPERERIDWTCAFAVS
jgi:hypothetical protein